MESPFQFTFWLAGWCLIVGAATVAADLVLYYGWEAIVG